MLMRSHAACWTAGRHAARLSKPASAGGRRFVAVRVTAQGASPAAAPLRYAVIGAGLAGLATTWHLLQQAAPGRRVHVDLYDAVGIGAGGSGAAAGLLHPISPKGKLLWRAEAAMRDALALVAVAEATAARSAAAALQCPPGTAPPSSGDAAAAAQSHTSGHFVWRLGMVRPAASARQALDYGKRLPRCPGSGASGGQSHDRQPPVTEGSTVKDYKQLDISSRCISRSEAEALLPGLTVPAFPSAPGQDTGQSDEEPGAHEVEAAVHPVRPDPDDSAALLVAGGVAVQPHAYLAHLWAACTQAAAQPGGNASVALHIRPVQSLAALCAERAAAGVAYDALVVATGAAVGTLPEVGPTRLPLSLCQGFSLDMEAGAQLQSRQSGLPDSDAAHSGLPSMLGQPYIAFHGNRHAVVGATQRKGLSPEEALEECGRLVASNDAAAAAATAELQAAAAQLWPPLREWRVARVRSGVRALPPRTHHGAIPLLGLLDNGANPPLVHDSDSASTASPTLPPVWIFVGLGSRGFVFHAWLGRLLAEAVVAGCEAGLPPETLAWRSLTEERRRSIVFDSS